MRVLSFSAGTAALVAATSALSSKWKKWQFCFAPHNFTVFLSTSIAAVVGEGHMTMRVVAQEIRAACCGRAAVLLLLQHFCLGLCEQAFTLKVLLPYVVLLPNTRLASLHSQCYFYSLVVSHSVAPVAWRKASVATLVQGCYASTSLPPAYLNRLAMLLQGSMLRA